MANGNGNGNGKKNRGKTVRKRNTSGLKRGGSPGRPKGVPNKVTREWKEIARELIYDKEVQESLLRRFRAGKADRLFEMMCHYAIGVPKQKFEVEAKGELTHKLHSETERFLEQYAEVLDAIAQGYSSGIAKDHDS